MNIEQIIMAQEIALMHVKLELIGRLHITEIDEVVNKVRESLKPGQTKLTRV
jgi:hypothetical protein